MKNMNATSTARPGVMMEFEMLSRWTPRVTIR